MTRSPDVPSSDVPSPCIGVCQMDPVTGFCQGCQRTLDEIAAWGGADTETRLAILERLDLRRRAGHTYLPRRGRRLRRG